MKNTSLRAHCISITLVPFLLVLIGCQPKTSLALCPNPQTQPKNLAYSDAHNEHLWARLRQRFVIQASKEPTHPKVQHTAIAYSQPAHKVQSLTRQAAPFMYYVLEQVEARDLPAELALIPMVESGFSARATSNRAAAGIWQIVPATAKQLGLSHDKFYDARRDIIRSTDAALNYLVYLHKVFDKDWMLSIAAYNAGMGTVQRAIAKNKAQGLPTRVWDLKLPQQTQDYVAKVLALAEIIRTPCLFDLELKEIDNKPYLAQVPIGKNAPLAYLAKVSGLSLRELKRYNGGYKNLYSHPKLGAQTLVLPIENAKKLHVHLAALKPKNKLAENNQYIDYLSYCVKAHDNLIKIAQKHQTQVTLIKHINQLSSDKVKTGQILLVPSQLAKNQSASLTP